MLKGERQMDFRTMYKKILSEYEQVFEKVDQNSLREFINAVEQHDRIFLIGIGREGMSTRAFAMRLMHMGKEVHWIWDDTTPGICPGDLVIATLGDGQIGHINYICERAKEAGGKIYAVTGSPSGETARTVADKVLFVPAAVYRGKDDVVPSFQPMGNLFEQCLLILFDMIVMTIVEETPELSFEKMSGRHRNVE
jgi:6-phospho-3-hexuloisomerase